MELIRIVKRAIALMHTKQVVPIQHIVDNGKMLEGKVAIVIGGTGG